MVKILKLYRSGAFMAKKILIVDDEPYIRMLLEQTLEDFEEQGVELLVAKDGMEALRAIKKEEPDLVYLDVMMPEINGYDICNIAKNTLLLKHVHIVLLTAKGQEFDKKKGLAVGADLYLTKPFDPDYIVEKTEEVLGIKL
jgi:DNA-binding response OmpR family regulator